ncbi:MAG TPA: metal-sensitive transcriptional regulator [Candidatus Gracilibacteria bacterium]|nr:metal-sensitive transcriptional regulator [Candidatus Gracilibacteria bacterium]
MEAKKDIQKRLNYVKGQLNGLTKMLEEEKDCVSILTQFKAAQAGLEKAGSLFAKSYLLHCLHDPKRSAEDLETLLRQALKF